MQHRPLPPLAGMEGGDVPLSGKQVLPLTMGWKDLLSLSPPVLDTNQALITAAASYH